MSNSLNVVSAAVLFLSLGLSGCAPAPSETPAEAPIPVTISYPVEREITDFADFTARTAAVESVEVRARVAGYLDKISFKEGTLVKKGDLLFQIDPRPYQAQVDFARAQVAANEALLKKAKADNTRYKSLARKSPNAVTSQDLDQYQAAEDQAIANQGTAKATLETNELNLGFTQVVSPIDGRTSRYNVTVGNLVQQDLTSLTTIVSVDPIYAYFDVDERTVPRVAQLIRAGKAGSASETEWPVSLGLATDEGFPRMGTVNFADNQVNPKTGTLRVRGVFPNEDGALSPGLFARVRLPIGPLHQALLVSDRAIDNDQGQKVLYVVNEKDKVDSIAVRVGALHDGLRTIEDGLNPGERVIVNGLQSIRPGVTVEPKLVDMPISGVKGEESPIRTQRLPVRVAKSTP
ncbi:MAG TPA: efflux RND transporter periplasmic adaptor subunit [Pirellulales bacterium]|nr:efflux RND transporter periplasmic adaptor subunit [Pirellulales bacterium]